MKTLILSSSLSKKSKSFLLCKAVFERLQAKGIDVSIIDAREYELLPTHRSSDAIEPIKKAFAKADNIIFGMGVHCYSVNDSLKIILDTCGENLKEKFFGILCAAGGEKSYLSTMHLTQICMNEWRMIQLPRIVYASGSDFDENKISSDDVIERIDIFTDEFIKIGEKLS
jgi:NAD(P)H-dependent FMN reductase